MEQELTDYRGHLLNALEDQPRRVREERPTRVQIFVNHECVGSVDCTESNPTYTFASRERSVQNLELRNESGALVGGVSAPEAGIKTARISLDRGCLHVHIQNKVEGGSAKVSFQRTPSWWTRLAGLPSRSPSAEPAMRQPAWSPAFAIGQVILAATVLGLLADRVPDWVGQGRSSAFLEEQRTSQQAMQEQFSRLEERMSRLADNQQVVMSSAKNGQDQLLQLSRQFDTIAQTQQKLSAQVVTAQEELHAVKGSVSDEVQNGVRVALTKAETDQQVMRQELQSVKSVNETLAKQVGLLEGKNRELHARLALATMEMAKNAAHPKSAAVAKAESPKETAPPPQVAEARRETDPQAFMFWVSFQDGTPEKSIEDLIQEINGTKKGPMNSGWYPVEVTLPKPEPPDRFLESIKRAKIVKAVATSTVIPPAQ
ncbi:MAG TPA: hypothetical protein VJ805_02950 [Nitrospiraceae bacterium]|nr:hypothetical protein [Nitrospiraceae bacterium]